jgi:hypothetical protein
VPPDPDLVAPPTPPAIGVVEQLLASSLGQEVVSIREDRRN